MHIFTANLHICFYIQTEFTSKTTIHHPTNHPPCWRWTRNRQKSACSAAWLGNAVRHDRAHYLATWPARPWRTPSHLERLTTTTLPTTRLPKRTPSWTPKAVRLVMSQPRRQRNSHSTYSCFFLWCLHNSEKPSLARDILLCICDMSMCDVVIYCLRRLCGIFGRVVLI